MPTENRSQVKKLSPSHIRVREWLNVHINKHNLGVGDRIPSERQLADALGISRLTVARAINRLVEEGMLMQQSRSGTFVGEGASTRAKSSNNTSTNTVALIIPGGPTSDEAWGHTPISSILQGISSVLASKGFHIVIHYYHYLGDEASILKDLENGQSDCAIIFPSFFQYNHMLYSQLTPQHPPVVLVDHYFPKLKIDRVVTDNFSGARDAVRILISKGHRRIACLSEHFGDITSVNDRIAGYRAALEEAGIAYDEELLCGPQILAGGSYNFDYVIEHLIRIPDPITAVFAINENVVWMVQHALLKLSPTIQCDLGLGGFFDVPVPAGVSTPFTRVVQPKYEIGQAAARLLLDRISGKAPAETQHIEIPPIVIE